MSPGNKEQQKILFEAFWSLGLQKHTQNEKSIKINILAFERITYWHIFKRKKLPSMKAAFPILL